jgi:hypothetical protein
VSGARSTAGSRSCVTVATVIAMALAGSAVTFPAALARADEPAPPVPSRRVVEVLVAGGAADDAGFDDTVRELLGRLALITDSQVASHIDAEEPSFRSTSRPSMLARVGIDLRTRDVVVITIVDGRTGDVAVRRTVRRDGSPAVVREEVAHVVQSAVDPMLVAERDRAAAPPPPPPAVAALPEPPPPAAPASPPDRDTPPRPAVAASPLALDLMTAAGGGSYAAGAGVIGRAGGGAALVWRRGIRPAVGLVAHYVFPFDTGAPIASAHVSVVSLRVLPAIELYGSSAVALDAIVGGGVDVLRVEPRSNALPPQRLGATLTRADPLVTAAVAGHVAITGGTALSLMLGVDVDLATRRWVVDADGERTATFAPSRVRPLAMIGFTFTAFGESRFAAGGAAR